MLVRDDLQVSGLGLKASINQGLLSQLKSEAPTLAGDPWSPWSQQNGFRLLDEGHDEVRWQDGGREVTVVVRRKRGGGLRLDLPGGAADAEATKIGDGALRIVLGGDSFEARAIKHTALDGGTDYTVFVGGGSRRLCLVDPLDVTQYEATAADETAVRSPLPGKIIDLKIKAGDSVSKGQPLLVLEAMKMEHTLNAPADGRIKSIRYAVGEQVPEGADLVEFEPG